MEEKPVAGNDFLGKLTRRCTTHSGIRSRMKKLFGRGYIIDKSPATFLSFAPPWRKCKNPRNSDGGGGSGGGELDLR